MPNRTFEHPKLGTLRSDDGWLWEGTLSLPGFETRGWQGDFDVQVYGDKSGPPEPTALALLDAIIANASTLPDMIVDALWNELSGQETQANTWWARAGGLATANEELDAPITTRDDLWSVLRPQALFVQTDGHGDGQLVAGVNLHCAFEVEHGLDVLTDGVRVLGTGYALDAQKYARFARPSE